MDLLIEEPKRVGPDWEINGEVWGSEYQAKKGRDKKGFRLLRDFHTLPDDVQREIVDLVTPIIIQRG